MHGGEAARGGVDNDLLAIAGDLNGASLAEAGRIAEVRGRGIEVDGGRSSAIENYKGSIRNDPIGCRIGNESEQSGRLILGRVTGENRAQAEDIRQISELLVCGGSIVELAHEFVNHLIFTDRHNSGLGCSQTTQARQDKQE